jgi:dolichol-phosphate mannosyltransferase
MKVGLVIPVYMSAEGLTDLSRMLMDQEEKFLQLGTTLQVIFVVDGSPDNSLDMLMKLRHEKRIPINSLIVKLSRNFGQTAAVLAGLELSDADCTICYSADMQDPSELFIPMYEHYKSGKEMVIAIRRSRSDGILWDLTSKIGYGLLRKEVPSIPKGGFDFFLIGRSAKLALLKRSGSMRFMQGDLLHLGFEPVEIEYDRVKRKHGKSAYTLRKRLNIFSNAFYDSSDLPIKVATRLGFSLSGVGFLTAIFFLIGYFRGLSPFNGFAALACAILVLGGLQLALIGFLGEYVYRIYDISRGRPVYVIDKIL